MPLRTVKKMYRFDIVAFSSSKKFFVLKLICKCSKKKGYVTKEFSDNQDAAQRGKRNQGQK